MSSHTAYQLFIIIALLIATIIGPVSAQVNGNDGHPHLHLSSNRPVFESLVTHLDTVLNAADRNHLPLIDSLWSWASHNGDTVDLLNVQYLKARHYMVVGQKSLAIRHWNRVYTSEYCSDTLRFEAALGLRNLYFDFDAFDKAVEFHRKLKWEHAPLSYEVIAPEVFLGGLYLKVGNYDASINAYRTATRKMKLHKLPYWEMSLTNNLGVVYERSGNLDSAWACYKRAMHILENKVQTGRDITPGNRNFCYGLFAGNMGQVLAERGEHLKAIPLLKSDITSSLADTTRSEYRENAISSLLKLADSYLAIAQVQKARDCLKKAHALLLTVESPEHWDHYYLCRAHYFSQINQTDSALFEMQLLINLRDSIQKQQSTTRSQSLLLTYESLLQDIEKQEREREIELLKRKAEIQRETNIVLAIAIIIAIIITGATVYRFKAKSKQQADIQRQHQEIEAQKRTIEASLKEKEILLREVNHRVKNNLQIISSLLFLQSRNIDDSKVKQVMDEARQRVQTMSVIHQKLYQESHLDHPDFSSFITDLIHQIIASYKPMDLQIATHIDIGYSEVPFDEAVPLSLIVHELITNSIKHAFKGRKKGQISVSLHKQDSYAILKYKDDGKGLSKSENYTDRDNNNNNNDRSHIGLKVIDLLAHQLNGTFHIKSELPLQIEIEFQGLGSGM